MVLVTPSFDLIDSLVRYTHTHQRLEALFVVTFEILCTLKEVEKRKKNKQRKRRTTGRGRSIGGEETEEPDEQNKKRQGGGEEAD
jgi:hypothetical protein